MNLRQNKLTNFWLLTSEPHAEIAQIILTQVLSARGCGGVTVTLAVRLLAGPLRARMWRASHEESAALPPAGRDACRKMQPDATKRDPDPVQGKRAHRAVP